MQNDKTNPTPSRVPSVDETTAMLEREETEQDARMRESSPKSVESTAFNASMQSSSSVKEESREVNSEDQTLGSDGRPLFEPKGIYFPTDSHETDEHAKRVLADRAVQFKSGRISPLNCRAFLPLWKRCSQWQNGHVVPHSRRRTWVTLRSNTH